MISYELAKKLKDNGFKQDGNNRNGYGDPELIDEKGGRIYDVCYVPTLSELIEACGDKFLRLTLLNNGEWSCETSDRQYAEPTNVGDTIQWGKTPEEAVANLWLKLNEQEPCSAHGVDVTCSNCEK